MRLWDDTDLERAESEGYAAGVEAERARITAIVATPAAKRNLAKAIEAALADGAMTAENTEARIAAASVKGASSGPSAREIYGRLNARSARHADEGSKSHEQDVYARCGRGG